MRDPRERSVQSVQSATRRRRREKEDLCEREVRHERNGFRMVSGEQVV